MLGGGEVIIVIFTIFRGGGGGGCGGTDFRAGWPVAVDGRLALGNERAAEMDTECSVVDLELDAPAATRGGFEWCIRMSRKAILILRNKYSAVQ